jgi:hypothetical protein
LPNNVILKGNYIFFINSKWLKSIFDIPPNYLKDSNANPNVKIIEEKKVGVHSLTYSTSGVRGVCWSSRMETRMNDKWVNYSHGPTQTKQQDG